MDYLELFNQALKEKGTTVSFVSRRTGLNYEVLRRTLRGTRPMRADELISVAAALGFEIVALPIKNEQDMDGTAQLRK